MRSWALIGLAMLSWVQPLMAQVRPVPGNGDPRLQTVQYQDNQVVAIEAAVGYQVTINLASDEQIQSAALGDSSAWQVTSNKSGNRLFVKPLVAGMATNLIVTTNVRSYAFELSGLATPSLLAPYVVSFEYSSSATPRAADDFMRRMDAAEGRYRLSGTRALRPAGISDDGVHTYIEWADDAALPATYYLNDKGRETLANGRMHGGVYVIDIVADRLVFRLDKHKASAIRLEADGKGR